MLASLSVISSSPSSSLKPLDTLGLVGTRDESYPSYFLSDGASMITLWQIEKGATPFNRCTNIGLHHLAIKVTSLEALTKVYLGVMAIQGVVSDFDLQELKGTGLTHAMVFEPSGNRIEFTHHAD